MLNAQHINNCSREISRWSKAVRLIHSLERNLSEGFPEPDSIEPGRKPFDLRITWKADNHGHSAKLRKRITAALKVEPKWNFAGPADYRLCTRIRLGTKTTMYLHLRIKGK